VLAVERWIVRKTRFNNIGASHFDQVPRHFLVIRLQLGEDLSAEMFVNGWLDFELAQLQNLLQAGAQQLGERFAALKKQQKMPT